MFFANAILVSFSFLPHRERKVLLIVFIKFQASLSFSFEQVWRFSFKLKKFQKAQLEQLVFVRKRGEYTSVLVFFAYSFATMHIPKTLVKLPVKHW